MSLSSLNLAGKKVLFKRLHPDARLPTMPNEGDAGYDIYALGAHKLWPSERVLVDTGIASAFDPLFVAVLKDRSGKATNFGLHVMAGVIDSSYRGEWKVLVVNLGSEPVTIESGDKICQVLFLPTFRLTVGETEELPLSRRGDKGFGSSGQ